MSWRRISVGRTQKSVGKEVPSSLVPIWKPFVYNSRRMNEQAGSRPTLQDGKVFGHWRLVLTGDGSPSFALDTTEKTELMHHRGGAYSETCYIYGPAIEAAMKLCREPQVLSVGLGLGYNELLTACLALQNGKSQAYRLQSFEVDSWLAEKFLNFIMGRDSGDPEMEVYRDMLSRFPEFPICESLRCAFAEKRWTLHGALESPAQIHGGTHSYLWDAFSQKTTPALWDQKFLEASFQTGSREGQFVATYACNAALKKALREQGFQIQIRPGFQGKRECTWGTKGIFTS